MTKKHLKEFIAWLEKEDREYFEIGRYVELLLNSQLDEVKKVIKRMKKDYYDKENWLNRKYSKPIKINGTKNQQKQFAENCKNFAPIAEQIIQKSIFNPTSL